MWVNKYKPKSLKEFVNQKEAVEVFLKWIKRWKPRSEALLFHGMPGVGKTALIEAYCSENKLDLIQLNASDYRSANQIKEVLGKSMQQQSLFKRGKLFMIDEVDGIAGREDYGGVKEIIEIIKSSAHPVILTANDPWNKKLMSLRRYWKLVEFKGINVWDIEKRLKEICEKEGIKPEKDVLRQIAKRSKGDLRSVINDLEIISQGKRVIALKDLEILGYRERKVNIFEVLRNIFKTQNALAARLAINASDKDPDEIFWWIENNIAREYEEPEEIAKAFDALSKADIFRNRISSRQNWRFKAYMIDLMTGGVATAKKEMYKKFTRYQYPSNIVTLGRTKKMRKDEKERLLELSNQLHCSTRKIRNEYLPFLRIMKSKSVHGEILE
jgi:replication factor C large subunit